MTALTNDFPQNSSRTSTQAITVPNTAFTTETSTASPRESLSAATDSGDDATDQNEPTPSAREAQTRAAIGNTTSTERYVVVKPSSSGVASPRRLRGAGIATLASGWPSDVSLDLGHAALVRVEPDLVRVAPAAELLVVDLEDAGARREFRRV